MQFTPENLPSLENEDQGAGPDRMFLLQLAAAVVVVLVAVGLVVAMTMGDESESVSTPTTPPETFEAQSVAGGTTSEAQRFQARAESAGASEAGDGSWRSEVVVYETPESESTATDAPPAANEPIEREAPPLLWTNEPAFEFEPTPYEPPASGQPSPPVNPPSEPTSASLPVIPDRDYRDCGTLAVPGGAGLFMFALTASSEPVIVCLGESIGASCGNHSAVIETPDLGVFAAVITEKPDGTCAVGAQLDADTLSLCSVERLMDIGVGPDQTEAQWRSDFRSDPGGMFVKMYLENRSVFEDPSAGTEHDCEVFAVE